MFNFYNRRLIIPDENSWLSEVIVDFFKSFHNEYFLTLWDALKEYAAFHNPHCAYLGKEFEGEVELYPKFEYDHATKTATLKKLFFLSKDMKTLVTHNYLAAPGYSRGLTPFLNFLYKKTNKDSEDYPCLEKLIMHNNMEPAVAKELLLKYSYKRREIQRLFIFENEAKGIEYKYINVTNIEFDLSFLEDCSFLAAKRYSSFRELLPESLKVTLSVPLKYDLPDIPRKLKAQQLLNASDIIE